MILHITNDYSGSTVYKNLVLELDNLGVSQIVYNPVRDKKKIGKNKVNLANIGSKIIYSHILSNYTSRVLYRRKIEKIIKDIESKIDMNTIDFIHAHTWYSDGGVAYLLHKKYNIPYIIAIRSSDLNLFQKYLIHQRKFGKNIIKYSKNVVLISASYKSKLLSETSLQSIKADLSKKLKIIPNGVDNFWVNNATLKKEKYETPLNCLFIGTFIKRKNIIQLQKAINEINKCSLKMELNLIGGGGRSHKKVMNIVDKNPQSMTYHGKIYDKNILKKHFEEADIFAMPSKNETFGLVYVEAMLQGLPILYTNKEGVDGFYDENIGEKVYSNGIDEIERKLIKMMTNYNDYEIPINKLKENHNWKNIAKKYKSLYSKSLA